MSTLNILTQKQRKFLKFHYEHRSLIFEPIRYQIGFILKYNIYNEYQKKMLNNTIKEWKRYKQAEKDLDDILDGYDETLY